MDVMIDKEQHRINAEDATEGSYQALDTAISNTAFQNTLTIIKSYQDKDQNMSLKDAMSKIRLARRSAIGWKENDFSAPEKFETQITQKASKYEGIGETEKENYFFGLGEEADQSRAAADVFEDFSRKAEEDLKPITTEQKTEAAYFLAEKIRAYGADIANTEKRQKLIEDEVLTKEEVDAILASNLVTNAEGNAPKFHTEGFANDEAWDRAVFETASGIMEQQLVKKINELSKRNLDKEIYEKAIEYYQKRTGKTDEEVAEEIKEEKPFAAASGEYAKARLDADIREKRPMQARATPFQSGPDSMRAKLEVEARGQQPAEVVPTVTVEEPETVPETIIPEKDVKPDESDATKGEIIDPVKPTAINKPNRWGRWSAKLGQGFGNLANWMGRKKVPPFD